MSANGDRLDGSVALVTGGSGAIGGEVAAKLAEQGARVAVHYSSADEAAERAAARARDAGGEACVVKADLTDEDEVRSLVGETRERLGAPDVLVHAAGVLRPQPVQRLTSADWDAMHMVNLRAAFLLVSACQQHMLERGFGRIVVLGSVSALRGTPAHAGYAAAKAGLTGMVKSVAAEAAPYNVTCNVVAPGYVPAEISSNGGDRARERIVDATPMRRPGTPCEIAAAVCFLCSHAASYITGQVLAVDGGLSM